MARYLSPMLYRYKPSLFVIAGLLAGTSLDHILGKAAAFILVCAGILIFNWRINAR